MPDKKLLTAAALTAALAAGGAGGAVLGRPLVTSAQQSDDSTTTTEAPDEGGRMHRRGLHFGLEAAAEALGMSADDLRSALRDGKTIADVAGEKGVDVQTVIDAMVADATERIDQRAADAKEELPDRITDLVNGEVPDHPDGPRGGLRAGLDAAAEALGISADDLRSAVRDGKTIADVAGEKGVDVQTVIDAMVADATERIDQRVSDGDLDADRAAELKQDLPQRITDLVNGEGPGPGPGPGFGHGPGRPFGPGD